MGVRDWITRNINNKLPTNRSDNQNLLYNQINQQYGWAARQSNKPLGDYEIYYMAGENVFVNAAINAYYNQLLSNGFTIKDSNSEIINIPRVNYITGLFNAPEGLKSNVRYSQFLRQIVHSYLLTGDAFVEISYDNILDHDVMNGFKYIAPELLTWYRDTEQFGFINNSNLRYEPDELIHIYDIPSRKDNIYGQSRIDTIGLALSLLFESLKYNKDFFKNKGLDPNAVLSFDKDMKDNDFMNEIGRLSIAAKSKSGRGMLAVKGGQVSSINRNTRDADFTSLLLLCRNIILNGYNCPPSIAGIVETSNLSANTIDSEMRLFKSPVNSVAETIEGAFNNALQRNGFQESFHFNPIDLTDKMEETQIDVMNLEAGILTINEIRVERGLETVPWGDAPLNYNNQGEIDVDEPDTGNPQLDEAFKLIRQSEANVYRNFDYMNGGLL